MNLNIGYTQYLGRVHAMRAYLRKMVHHTCCATHAAPHMLRRVAQTAKSVIIVVICHIWKTRCSNFIFYKSLTIKYVINFHLTRNINKYVNIELQRSFLKQGTPVNYFCPALDPPLGGSGRKATTLVRDHEYFMHTKFYQNPSSGSGEVENVKVYGRRMVRYDNSSLEPSAQVS